MATVINNPSGTATRDENGAAAGWVVAAVVLVAAVLVALFVWPGWVRQNAAPAAAPSGIDVNVDLPAPSVPTPSAPAPSAPAPSGAVTP